MKTILKIPRCLFEEAKADLVRLHPFAAERVGFFSTRCSRAKGTTLVHCIAYAPVHDEHYIEDETVGARIGPGAITQAMARSLNLSVGQLHVHYHGGRGLPHPSQTDSCELPLLAGSFRNANNAENHGWMILSENDAYASLMLPGQPNAASGLPVSIVGFPTVVNQRGHPSNFGNLVSRLIGRLKKRRHEEARYSRQSFLGGDSDAVITRTVVGVVGLGGGGSHIVQQLAHLGFKNFVVCDDDLISISNLNRLVGGTLADVRAKRLKTIIAERSVRRLHKNASIICPGVKWEESAEDLIGCDLIVGCVDTFSARRDLEAFCRRHIIPYLDVGMDVHELANGRFEIDGQVILSMPGKPCMQCMGVLNENVLALEAAKYDAAGAQPQVVWSNGLLCSAAVGVVVDLLTDWSGTLREPVYLAFRGSSLSLSADNRVRALWGVACRHYPLDKAGDAVFRPFV
jgi:ThiF family protein